MTRKDEAAADFTTLVATVQGLSVKLDAFMDKTEETLERMSEAFNRHDEILFREAGEKKAGLVTQARENTEFREGMQAEGVWFRRAVIAALVGLVLTQLYGCLRISDLNGQVHAEATIMATEERETRPPLSTSNPTAIPTAGPTMTSSIAEVAPRPTKTIEELPTPFGYEPLAPGKIVREKGYFIPEHWSPVYACPGLECIVRAHVEGLIPVVTEGVTLDNRNNGWVCLNVSDDGRAQICTNALLWVTSAKEFKGHYYLGPIMPTATPSAVERKP